MTNATSGGPTPTPPAVSEALMRFSPVQHAVAIVTEETGEIVLEGEVQMRFLETGATTDGRLAVAHTVVQPGARSGPQHRHDLHDEGFFVLSGVARFSVADAVHDAGPGTFVIVPPGAPHKFHNPSDEPLEMLTTFTPNLYVGYFRDLQDMSAGRGYPSDESLAEVYLRYHTRKSDRYARPPEPSA